jgi:undecaprenyl phosphate N,N'-diacetylbacillosamine 1-phosphate transferase
MLYSKYLKRLFDFVSSLIALPLVIVIVLIASPFIYFTDKGPIFYNAIRIGQFGKPFKMFKLRTMFVNALDIRLEDGSTFNSDDDPRLTKIGKILRKSSIDELPQIINVLIGDMSLIGPRPDPLDWLERYTIEQREFLKVKPGISGYNQAYFRNSADGVTKLKNDLYYARNISFKFDVKILFKTIRTILLRENLYIEELRK